MINPRDPYPDAAFMVDENYRGRGIASALLHYLIEIAKERGMQGFSAEVLTSNRSMMKVFERLPYVLHKTAEDSMMFLKFNFEELKGSLDNICPKA